MADNPVLDVQIAAYLERGYTDLDVSNTLLKQAHEALVARHQMLVHYQAIITRLEGEIRDAIITAQTEADFVRGDGDHG